MPHRNKFAAGLFLLANCLSCAPTEVTDVTEPAAAGERAPNFREGISSAVQSFERAVLAGNFSDLRDMLYSNNFTFKQNGEIYQHIRCFIVWEPVCRTNKTDIYNILKDNHFLYYHHIDDDNIVVNFIKESARKSFYDNPAKFLEQNYLSDYFSCHFVRRGSVWLLKESLCYSETEGFFGPEPDV